MINGFFPLHKPECGSPKAMRARMRDRQQFNTPLFPLLSDHNVFYQKISSSPSWPKNGFCVHCSSSAFFSFFYYRLNQSYRFLSIPYSIFSIQYFVCLLHGRIEQFYQKIPSSLLWPKNGFCVHCSSSAFFSSFTIG